MLPTDPDAVRPSHWVAENTRWFRERRGWTQEELLSRVQEHGMLVNASTISRIESGSRKVTIDELTTLAIALGVPVVRMLHGEDESTSYRVSEWTVFASTDTAHDWMTGGSPQGGLRVSQTRPLLSDDHPQHPDRFYLDEGSTIQQRQAHRLVPELRALKRLARRAESLLGATASKVSPGFGPGQPVPRPREMSRQERAELLRHSARVLAELAGLVASSREKVDALLAAADLTSTTESRNDRPTSA